MPERHLPPEDLRRIRELGKIDIIIGIPSYNNVRTVGHVVHAAQAGLAKYFPQFTSLIINSDGGSADGTREAVLSTRVEDSHLLMLATPKFPVHRLSLPYHGIPGKGSAFRLIFRLSEMFESKAVAVVDSDLRSITPEWFDLLLRPIVYADYDFVAPYYHRHKYDGTITNSIVYPMTRSLYGCRVRQPIGGDFGMSGRLVSRYLQRNDWETDVARYGIDIWMTTIALAEGFRVCQSFLGAKLHDAKDPGADLSAMLLQVVGSVFTLMQEYESVWKARSGSEPVDLFGFRFDVGLDPIDVNLGRMLQAFSKGCKDLSEIWSMALDAEVLDALLRLGRQAGTGDTSFHLPDELWARVICDFAIAHHNKPPERSHMLRSLTPLYLGRVASFVIETQNLFSAQVDERIENLCLCFENLKPYLAERWDAFPAPQQRKPGSSARAAGPESATVEVPQT